MYKLIRDVFTGEIKDDQILKDGVIWVPNDPANRDWQEYQEWLALGNEPEPAD